MKEVIAYPWAYSDDGEPLNLFLETLTNHDAQEVLKDLFSGKKVVLPEHQGYPKKEVSIHAKDPNKRIDPEQAAFTKFPAYTKGAIKPLFKYMDGEYVPFSESSSPESVLAKYASVLKGKLRKVVESGKPIVFLGGECSDDNKWRKDIIEEFGDKLAFVDPYDEEWEAEDNIYDELTAILKSDHVVFFKGGEGTKREKDFLKAVGDPEDFKEFDDFGALRTYIDNLSKPVSVKTAREDGVYRSSTTQVDLPEDLGKEVIAWGKENISDDDLVDDEKNSMGREDEMHVTVLYGIQEDTPDSFRKIVEGVAPFEVRLGLVTLFRDKKEYDVVKIDVEAPELHTLHDGIKNSSVNKSTFPTYVPHLTVAYVKKDSGNKVLGSDEFKGKVFKVDSVIFKDTKKNEIKIPLNGKS